MSRGGGFTLIEMLVVVAILVILATIIFPVYEVVTKRAEAVSCVSNIRSLAMAASMYAEDYDEKLIPARVSVGPPGTFGTAWNVLLEPYHREPKLYLCPSDPMPTVASGTVSYPSSYGVNLDLTMVGGYNGASLTLSDIESPTRTVLFFEIRGSVREFGSSYELNGLSRVDVRHNMGSNFAFVDGHARWYRPREMLNPHNMWLPSN